MREREKERGKDGPKHEEKTRQTIRECERYL